MLLSSDIASGDREDVKDEALMIEKYDMLFIVLEEKLKIQIIDRSNRPQKQKNQEEGEGLLLLAGGR